MTRTSRSFSVYSHFTITYAFFAGIQGSFADTRAGLSGGGKTFTHTHTYYIINMYITLSTYTDIYAYSHIHIHITSQTCICIRKKLFSPFLLIFPLHNYICLFCGHTGLFCGCAGWALWWGSFFADAPDFCVGKYGFLSQLYCRWHEPRAAPLCFSTEHLHMVLL